MNSRLFNKRYSHIEGFAGLQIRATEKLNLIQKYPKIVDVWAVKTKQTKLKLSALHWNDDMNTCIKYLRWKNHQYVGSVA